MEFGASDLGGPKDKSPSGDNDVTAKLADEQVRRSTWSRFFAAIALAVLSLSAVGCLGFAMYVGCHFLGLLDGEAGRIKAQATVASIAVRTAPAQLAKVDQLPPRATAAQTAATGGASRESTDLYLQILAPLIPASFSSALAIILFITVARLVTNFERIGREDTGKDKTEDYGAIAALVQEIGKMIQTLKGKG